MNYMILANRLQKLVEDQSKWSQETFGSDRQKGPIGPLRHLEKEACEAQESPNDISEYADCLLLILDASRRAGFDISALVYAAQEKLKVNQTRDYGKAPVYCVDRISQSDNIIPAYQVRITAENGKPVYGQGFTEDEALETAWKNVRRLFDNPVEHVRK